MLPAEGGPAGVHLAGQPLLDPDSIERLHQLDPSGQQGVVQRVLRAYESSLSRHLDEIAQAFAGGDSERQARSAHTLKSSSAAIGALGFAQRCADLEQLVRHDKGVPGSDLVEALIHEGRLVLVAVGAMLAP